MTALLENAQSDAIIYSRYLSEEQKEEKFIELHRNDPEKILNYFDNNRALYGPKLDITRKQRLSRALKLGLRPHIVIINLVNDEDRKRLNKLLNDK